MEHIPFEVLAQWLERCPYKTDAPGSSPGDLTRG